MYYSQLFSLSVLAVLSTAKPTPAKLAPRACTTQLPSYYQQLSEVNGSEIYMRNNAFAVSQLMTDVNNTDTIVGFEGVPGGSYACQLNVAFASLENVTSSGNTQLNVYTVSNNVTSVNTFFTYHTNGEASPVGSLWGTGTVGDTTVVMNSQVCSSNQTFLVKLASEDEAGSVAFPDGSAPDASVINGFYMTYNC